MDADALRQRIAELREYEAKLWAQLHGAEGARGELEHWLRELEKPQVLQVPEAETACAP